MLTRFLRAIRLRLATRLARRNARSDTRAVLARGPFSRVMVVCYGNIYRSPFVAQALRDALGTSIEVRSAGFHRKAGRSSPDAHIRMSGERGVALQDHRSAQLLADDLRWADLIVLMDRYNWARLAAMEADTSKLVWLGSLIDGPVEIPDPYGFDETRAIEVIDQMARATQALAGFLRKN